MATTFDRETWKARVAAWWRDTALDWQSAMDDLGLGTAYGLLTASAFLPLLEVYGDDPGPAVATLSDVVSSVGTNLLSNLVQGAYDKANAPRRAEQEIAERPELREEYQRFAGGGRLSPGARCRTRICSAACRAGPPTLPTATPMACAVPCWPSRCQPRARPWAGLVRSSAYRLSISAWGAIEY